MARPQVTLAQPSMVTLRGQTHSRIIVGQLQTGVYSTVLPLQNIVGTMLIVFIDTVNSFKY